MAPTDPLVLVNSGEQRSYGHISSLSSPLLEKLRDAVQLVCPKPKDGCTLQYPPGSIPLEGTVCPARHLSRLSPSSLGAQIQCMLPLQEMDSLSDPKGALCTGIPARECLCCPSRCASETIKCTEKLLPAKGRWPSRVPFFSWQRCCLTQVPCPKDLGEFLQRSACSAPWLDNVAPQARVHSEALSIFQSIHGAAGQDLATLVQEVTGTLAVHCTLPLLTGSAGPPAAALSCSDIWMLARTDRGQPLELQLMCNF